MEWHISEAAVRNPSIWSGFLKRVQFSELSLILILCVFVSRERVKQRAALREAALCFRKGMLCCICIYLRPRSKTAGVLFILLIFAQADQSQSGKEGKHWCKTSQNHIKPMIRVWRDIGWNFACCWAVLRHICADGHYGEDKQDKGNHDQNDANNSLGCHRTFLLLFPFEMFFQIQMRKILENRQRQASFLAKTFLP